MQEGVIEGAVVGMGGNVGAQRRRCLLGGGEGNAAPVLLHPEHQPHSIELETHPAEEAQVLRIEIKVSNDGPLKG
jgi:hypothetical protein